MPSRSLEHRCGWKSYTYSTPHTLHKYLRAALFKDDVTLTEFFISCAHAYVTGQISVTRNPSIRKAPDFLADGAIDEYRAILRTPSGEILNPLPITDEYL